MTDRELLEKLKRVDEIDLLELLDVTSEDLVNYLTDRILEDRERYVAYLKETE